MLVPLGVPSPLMVTLSLGGEVAAPGWANVVRKAPAKQLQATYVNGIPSASMVLRICTFTANVEPAGSIAF